MSEADSLIRRRGSRSKKGKKAAPLGEQNMEAVLDYYGIEYKHMHGAQKIRCPFHDDGHASCALNLEAGWLNCHACSATAGDALQVVRLKESCDFPTAKRRYAEITGTALADSPMSSAPEKVARGKGYRPKFKGSLLG